MESVTENVRNKSCAKCENQMALPGLLFEIIISKNY